MEKFENAGPISEMGSVIERRQVMQFLVGTTVLTGIGLITLFALLFLIANITVPGAYFILIVGSLVGGVIGTILAIRHESETVFIPYLRVSPSNTVRILRTPEFVDGTNYQYHIIIDVDDSDFVVRYKGLGESHEELHVTDVSKQEYTQVEYDLQRFAELNRSVYIRDLTLE